MKKTSRCLDLRSGIIKNKKPEKKPIRSIGSLKRGEKRGEFNLESLGVFGGGKTERRNRLIKSVNKKRILRKALRVKDS